MNHVIACPVDEDIGDVVLEAMAPFVNRSNAGLHGAGIPYIEEKGCHVCNIAVITDTSRHVIEYENQKIHQEFVQSTLWYFILYIYQRSLLRARSLSLSLPPSLSALCLSVCLSLCVRARMRVRVFIISLLRYVLIKSPKSLLTFLLYSW